MIFLIVNLLKEYNYNINKENCAQFIRDLMHQLDADQMEQVKKMQKLLKEDMEKNFDNEFDR